MTDDHIKNVVFLSTDVRDLRAAVVDPRSRPLPGRLCRLPWRSGAGADGTSLWAPRCAGCHGAMGEGVAGSARSLTAGPGLSERTDRALFVELSRGPHVERRTERRAALAVGRARPGALPGRRAAARRIAGATRIHRRAR
jgi:hypothetical protein